MIVERCASVTESCQGLALTLAPAGVVSCRTPSHFVVRLGAGGRKVAGGIPGAALHAALVHAGDLSSSPLGPAKTCLVRRTGERPKACEVREDWCGSPVFRGPLNPFPPGAEVRPASCICAGQSPNLVAEADGNRTRRGTFVPPHGFEGMSDARAAFSPVTSVFVSRRRPRTCKDL